MLSSFGIMLNYSTFRALDVWWEVFGVLYLSGNLSAQYFFLLSVSFWCKFLLVALPVGVVTPLKWSSVLYYTAVLLIGTYSVELKRMEDKEFTAEYSLKNLWRCSLFSFKQVISNVWFLSIYCSSCWNLTLFSNVEYVLDKAMTGRGCSTFALSRKTFHDVILLCMRWFADCESYVSSRLFFLWFSTLESGNVANEIDFSRGY